MSSWSEARLRKHLRTRYDRVTIQQVCAVKDQNYEPRDLAVWVRADREWSKLSPSRVQELWQANTKERSRSFCRFISRDLLKLSSQEYAGVKRSLESADSEELTGIYQARDASDDEYALVIEFPSSSALVRNLLIAGASVGGVLAAGAIAKQVRSKYANSNPDSTKSTSVDDVQKHQLELARRHSELSALDEEIKRKNQEDGALDLSINGRRIELRSIEERVQRQQKDAADELERQQLQLAEERHQFEVWKANQQRFEDEQFAQSQREHEDLMKRLEEDSRAAIQKQNELRQAMLAEDQKLEAKRSEVLEAQRSLEDVARQVGESESQLAGLRQLHEHENKEHSIEVARLEARTRELSAEVGSLQQQRAEVQRLRDVAAELRATIDGRARELETLESEHQRRNEE